MGNAETRSVTKPSRATCLTFESQARVVLRGSVKDELNGAPRLMPTYRNPYRATAFVTSAA